jgi:hypothetical protein
MCAIDPIMTLQLGPTAFEALALAATFVLFALRVAAQARLMRPAATANI